jgi:hypothetical protein
VTAWQAVALGGWGLAVLGTACAIVVRVISRAPFIPDAFGFGPTAMVAIMAMGLSWASIGAFLVMRRPENPIGRIMVAFGTAYALSMLTAALALAFFAQGTPEGHRLAALAAWATVVFTTFGALEFFIGFIFPTGRAQSPRWEPIVRLYWVFMVVFVAVILFQPGPLHLFPTIHNPFGFGPDLRAGQLLVSPIVTLFGGIITPLFGVSLATRYRAASRTERQQLKWLFLALAISGLGLGFVVYRALIADRPDEFGLSVYAFAAAGVPVAIAIAILRHNLYDIDRLISRTIAYAAVSAILGLVAGGVIVLLSAALASYTEGQTIAVAASTVIAFTAFQPVLRRVRGAVDRRFNRAHYDTERTIAQFGDRLRDEIDLGALTANLDATICDAIAPRSFGIWLRQSQR